MNEYKFRSYLYIGMRQFKFQQEQFLYRVNHITLRSTRALKLKRMQNIRMPKDSLHPYFVWVKDYLIVSFSL